MEHMEIYEYRFLEVDRTWSRWHRCEQRIWYCLRNANDFEKRISHGQ